ncbi:MAG TPA: undecaprenyl-diphosphate phosphatase [Thermoleophilaceae bacterium]|nr:undecaprenyl-diphosphate phosphatase [Thermoleophilaceae bacterium]
MRHAVALGLVQGPTELIPISSSGHVVLVPVLLGWPYPSLDPALRKGFEVALHLGTAAGLAVALRREVMAVVGGLDRRRLYDMVLGAAPATAAGLALRHPVEGRLSIPRRVAAAQVVAGAALLLADRRPADREESDWRPADAVAMGLAQAAALAPGVSRGGAALTALRLRRMDRRSASVRSRHAAAPVVLGAAVLEAIRLRGGIPTPLLRSFAAGAGAAFCSTIAAADLVPRMDRARTYAPLALYRMVLGGVALHRLERSRRKVPRPLDRLQWRA